MATSGTYVWTLTRDQLITGALRKLGVLAEGGTPSANQISDANVAINALIKAFHADGMPLWEVLAYTFTVTSGTADYNIGISQTLNTAAPLKVIQALRTTTGQSAVPMSVYNRYDFKLLPNANTSGTPVNLYYHPFIQTGAIHLWPTPNDSTTTITLQYQCPFQDMNASTDNFDFPPYWMQALIYNLAWSLSPEYGIPPTDRGLLSQEAKYWKDEALSYGSEEGSIFISPDVRTM